MADDLDAVSEPVGELGCVTGKTVIINLKIICIPVYEKPQLSGNLERICSVEDEIQRTEYGALRNALLHDRRRGCCPVVPHVLFPTNKVRPHPVQHQTSESERCLKSTEEDAVIHAIEGGTQIKHTEQS